MVPGELLALLETLKLPVEVPAAMGEKATFRVAFWPGVRTSPADTPLVEKRLDEVLMLEIVTLEFPVFESVTLRVPEPPIATLPKLRFVEFALNSEVAGTPVPLTLTVAGALEALVITETTPETLPVLFGE